MCVSLEVHVILKQQSESHAGKSSIAVKPAQQMRSSAGAACVKMCCPPCNVLWHFEQTVADIPFNLAGHVLNELICHESVFQ